MPAELTDKEKVKLAIIATEEVPEEVVEKMFLDIKIGSEGDLLELWGALSKHRPSIANKFAGVFKKCL